MWEILGVIFAIASSLVFASSAYLVGEKLLQEQARDYFAQNVALEWNEFGKALKTYVSEHEDEISEGDTYITCDFLKNKGYLSPNFNCVDSLGETLEGVVTKPIGVLQSIIVYPASPANSKVLKKLGIDDNLSYRSFIFKINEYVKKLNPDWELVAQKRNGRFEEALAPTSGNLKNYTSGTFTHEKIFYPDGYSYAPLLFVKRARSVGYWVWIVDGTDKKTIRFKNVGFSSVCPTPAALPKEPPNSEWRFGFYDANYRIYVHTIPYFYICIPASKDTVLKNPTASVPAITLSPDNDWAKENFVGKTDPNSGISVYRMLVDLGLGGNTVIGIREIKIGTRTYSLFITKDLYGNALLSDGTTKAGLIGHSPIIFVKGTPPSTWCYDFSHWGNYNYCFNLIDLLTSAGGSIQTVEFKE